MFSIHRRGDIFDKVEAKRRTSGRRMGCRFLRQAGAPRPEDSSVATQEAAAELCDAKMTPVYVAECQGFLIEAAACTYIYIYISVYIHMYTYVYIYIYVCVCYRRLNAGTHSNAP